MNADKLTLKELIEIEARIYEDSCHNPSIQRHYTEGAECMKKLLIDKACEWLSTLPEQLDVYEDSHYVIDRDTLIEQFKQAMEE